MNTPDEDAMTQEHTAIEVTQAARDAAADHMINCYANSAETAFAVRTGQRDDNWLVQAFARFERDTISRHRLAQPSITPAAELVPFGYWVEQRHADPVLWRKPAYIPEPNDNRSVTPLYALSTAPTTEPQPASNDAVREAAVALALAAGELNMALDGQEKYRRHRQLVVDAMQALVTQLATPPEPQPASNDAVPRNRTQVLGDIAAAYEADDEEYAFDRALDAAYDAGRKAALSLPPAGQTGVDEGLVERIKAHVEKYDTPLDTDQRRRYTIAQLETAIRLSRRSPVAEGEEGR